MSQTEAGPLERVTCASEQETQLGTGESSLTAESL